MTKPRKFEIRLYAFTQDAEGLLSILDIVETSYQNASFFMRRWYRDVEVTHVSAVSPSASITLDMPTPRKIIR